MIAHALDQFGRNSQRRLGPPHERIVKLEAALEKAQFALLYGDKEEFSEALDAIDAALKDKP